MRSDTLLREARERFVALLDRPGGARQRAAEAWRGRSPAHEAAWQEIEADWGAMEPGAELLSGLEDSEVAGYLGAVKQRRARRLAAGMALCLVLFAGLAGATWLERPHLLQDLTASHVAPRLQRELVTLADGSTVLLDADSAIDADVTATARTVRLLRGAAHFEVTPAATPFVVHTPQGEVRVLGTGFDVRLSEALTQVTLEHGRVEVAGVSGQGKAVLAPGERIDLGANRAGPVESVDLDEAMAWQDGRFVFYQMPLGDVLAEIERYRKGQIVTASKALARKRVTGSFLLDDADAALESLRAGLGFHVTRLGPRLLIVAP